MPRKLKETSKVVNCECMHEDCAGSVTVQHWSGSRIATLWFVESQHHNGLDLTWRGLDELRIGLVAVLDTRKILEV